MTPSAPPINRRERVVDAISLGAVRQLREFVDDLSERAYDEDIPELQEIADEIARLYREASRGLCLDCGSYEKCPCDDMADQIATGGY